MATDTHSKHRFAESLHVADAPQQKETNIVLLLFLHTKGQDNGAIRFSIDTFPVLINSGAIMSKYVITVDTSRYGVPAYKRNPCCGDSKEKDKKISKVQECLCGK